MGNQKKIIIIIAFSITGYLVYISQFWIAFTLLLIILLTMDYLSKSTFDNANSEFKKAQGSFPEGKLKKYSKDTGSTILKASKKDLNKTVAARDEADKKLVKGSENFFSELKDIFK